MRVVTKADLQRFREEALSRGRRNIVDNIVKQVREVAERGGVKYAHQYEEGWKYHFTPEEIVRELRFIFIDIDIEYAEPYISIRWN
jgi:hypothetical protein